MGFFNNLFGSKKSDVAEILAGHRRDFQMFATMSDEQRMPIGIGTYLATNILVQEFGHKQPIPCLDVVARSRLPAAQR